MKHYYVLFTLVFGLFSGQKLRVEDSETGAPVPNARIILHNQIVYTNEDGFAPVDQDAADFGVSASGFQSAVIPAYNPSVKLKRAYKNIDEVKMASVDLREIFENINTNYKKRYYRKPSVYNVVYKEKKTDNDKLYFLAIAEAKLWSKSNYYSYRDGAKMDYDQILQMQLNNVKYLKNNKSDSIFTTGNREFSHEYIGNYFFNFELNRVLFHIKSKGAKYSGTMVFEDGNEQLVIFKIRSGEGIEMKGEFKYNTADKVITYFEVHYIQENYPMVKRKTAGGEEYDYKLGNAMLVFDFYKNDDGYVPALTKLEGYKYFAVYKGVKHEKNFSRELIYNTFRKSDDKGLDPKVDFSKNIWDNVPVKENKNNTILLSEEEQIFMNGK
ncbi:carboxypeptidase-like regulatory domain-containing protein [Chryseobacterium sp. MYb328]|uniref:carboxypeptidase-like regulatory domain-containing protein n=1 Tax=Chryseobacterium sp. MYb328 TaxID=2745231 RepID=UPI0030A18433